MQYFESIVLIIYFTIFPIAVIWYLYKISNTFEDISRKLNIKQPEAESKIKRIHSSIAKSDYENAFGGRKAYEIYQNQDGLYEPVMPSKGIELKKKEE